MMENETSVRCKNLLTAINTSLNRSKTTAATLVRALCLTTLVAACAAVPTDLPASKDKVSVQLSQPLGVPKQPVRKTAEDLSLTAELSNYTVINGGVLSLTIEFPKNKRPDSLSAWFGTIELPLFQIYRPEKQDSIFLQTLFGIPLSTKPSPAAIEVQYFENQSLKKMWLFFSIRDGGYASEGLKVDPKHVKLKPKDLARVKRESEQIRKIYEKPRLEKNWTGAFFLPIESEITSPYGTSRIFNGELQSYHAGLDFRAPVGSPIRAPAAGVVVLAKALFLSGNTVILDHGYGVFTSYAHLSELKVQTGGAVKTLDILGLSGMSGRASGPHLHWGAILHRVKVNPMELTRIEF